MVDLDPLPRNPTWPELIEYEVNRQLGGDATVGQIVSLMQSMGWRPPEAPTLGAPRNGNVRRLVRGS